MKMSDKEQNKKERENIRLRKDVGSGRKEGEEKER